MNLLERFIQPANGVVFGKPREPRVAGGAGSGNWGHAGRPGQQGGSAPPGPEAAPPVTNEVARSIHEMFATGIGVTAIAKKLGWHRTTFVRDVLSKYDAEGRISSGGEIIKKVEPPPPPKAPPPKAVVPPFVRPDIGDARLRYEKPHFTPIGRLIEDRKGGTTTWHTAHGDEVSVSVDPDVSTIHQVPVRNALAQIPTHFFHSAGVKGRVPHLRVANLLISGPYGNQKAESWHPAGQYNVLQNEIRVAVGSTSYMPHVLLHEMGHGLHYNSHRNFGPNKEFRRAFREDRKAIVRGKHGQFAQQYREFAYWRANWKEAFAESTAMHTSDYDPDRRARWFKAFPRSSEIVKQGLQKLLSKDVKKIRRERQK